MMVNNTVGHFVGLTWGSDIFEKMGTSERGCVEIEDWDTSAYFALGFQENSMQSLSPFF